MGNRLELQTILEGVLGTRNVYFQPPESIKIVHPAIIYSKSSEFIKFANNGLYKNVKRYTVIVIDKDPDSDIPDKVLRLPLCSFDRYYTKNNLNYNVYSLYF